MVRYRHINSSTTHDIISYQRTYKNIYSAIRVQNKREKMVSRGGVMRFYYCSLLYRRPFLQEETRESLDNITYRHILLLLFSS